MSEFNGLFDEEKEVLPDPVEDEASDPFSEEYAPGFTLVTLMRIYDVQMALLNETNPSVATKLHGLHEQGKILGSFPWIDPDA